MRSKALSPVIAVILMVAVAVAAAVLAYTWGVAFQARTQAQVGERAAGIGAYAIKIESVDATNDVIYVRNVGGASIPSGYWSVYIDGVRCTDLNGGNSDVSDDGYAPNPLAQNSLLTIDVNSSVSGCDISSGHTVKVTGPEGVNDQFPVS